MVKSAGIWKRIKNGLGKVAKGINKLAAGYNSFKQKVYPYISPITHLLPGGAILDKVITSYNEIEGKAIDWVGDKLDQVQNFQNNPVNFSKSNVGPPGQPQSVPETTRAYFRSRGNTKPRYFQ